MNIRICNAVRFFIALQRFQIVETFIMRTGIPEYGEYVKDILHNVRLETKLSSDVILILIFEMRVECAYRSERQGVYKYPEWDITMIKHIMRDHRTVFSKLVRDLTLNSGDQIYDLTCFLRESFVFVFADICIEVGYDEIVCMRAY